MAETSSLCRLWPTNCCKYHLFLGACPGCSLLCSQDSDCGFRSLTSVDGNNLFP